MNAVKLIISFGLLYGLYVMQGVYQAETAHAAFAEDLDREIARMEVTRDDREGRAIIRKHVRKVAGEHRIPLDERRMKVTFQHSPKSVDGRRFGVSHGVAGLAYGETPYHDIRRATVSLSYKRSITPYYIRQFFYTGAGRYPRNGSAEIP